MRFLFGVPNSTIINDKSCGSSFSVAIFYWGKILLDVFVGFIIKKADVVLRVSLLKALQLAPVDVTCLVDKLALTVSGFHSNNDPGHLLFTSRLNDVLVKVL